MTSSTEALQTELGKSLMEYQATFSEELKIEAKYDLDLKELDKVYDEDKTRIKNQRKSLVTHLSRLMQVANDAADGKDIVLAKLAAEEPSKEKIMTAGELLKRIRLKGSSKYYDPFEKLITENDYDDDDN